jgi:predicted PurR-regulated permease PerM
MDNSLYKHRDPMLKTARYLQIVLFSSLILFWGRTLFIPACFGLLIAIVMYPICKRLEAARWRRSWAITLALSIVILLFAFILWLLSLETTYLLHDIPAITTKLTRLSPEVYGIVEKNWGVPADVQQSWLTKLITDVQESLTTSLGSLLTATASTIFMLIMAPIFAALFLYERESFVRFLEMATGPRFNGKLHSILQKTTHTYFGFIKGTFKVYIIVGVLNSIGLFALGIKHALLYGMLTAFMTVIPYAGIIISALLPITTAILTKDSIWYPIGIIGIFSFVQYLEGNIIFPKVVATQLNVSTWATLVAILLGTIIWGVAGMILFIPFVAILKIITDHVDEWKAINVLLSRK